MMPPTYTCMEKAGQTCEVGTTCPTGKTTATGTCESGQICCKEVTPPACTPGTKRCDGDNACLCNADGTETCIDCDYGCNNINGNCKPEPVDPCLYVNCFTDPGNPCC